MIELTDIRKSYVDANVRTDVLKGVFLHIEDGELVTIIGKAGCGKTTLLNIIGCIDTFDSGMYYLNGKDIGAFSEKSLPAVRNRNIGYMTQALSLIPKLDLVENVALPLRYAGVRKKERRQSAMEILQKVGLGDKMKDKPAQLSAEQLQRVSAARAVIGNPQLILADEPTEGLDSDSAEKIIDFLITLNRDKKTVIIATRDAELAKICKKRIVLADGKIVPQNVLYH